MININPKTINNYEKKNIIHHNVPYGTDAIHPV